jgi:hypothetical protein
MISMAKYESLDVLAAVPRHNKCSRIIGAGGYAGTAFQI